MQNVAHVSMDLRIGRSKASSERKREAEKEDMDAAERKITWRLINQSDSILFSSTSMFTTL